MVRATNENTKKALCKGKHGATSQSVTPTAGPILMTIYKFIEALKAKGKDPLAVECVFIKLFQDTGSQTLCEELMHRSCRWVTSVWLLSAFWLVCRAML